MYYVVYLPNLTLSVPEPLFSRMRRFAWVKWSEISRQAIESKLNELEGRPKDIVVRGMPVPAGRIRNKILRWVDASEAEPTRREGKGG